MWDDLVAWFQSPGGARVLQTAIIPALAILVAGVLAALIARAAVRGVLRRSDRVEASSAVAALVAAATAATDPDADRGARRRAGRLRAEADVRTRLLPLPGAGLAADWAAGRTDALQQRSTDAPVSAELDELRDRLVEWAGKPSRAKRIFAGPAATVAPVVKSRAAAPAAEAAPAEPANARARPEEPPVEQERSARPSTPTAATAPGPRRTPPEPEPERATAAEPQPDAASTTPEPAVAVAAAGLPAWQRTRAVERLQQERGRTRGVEAPTTDEAEPVAVSTAPVQLSQAHRAPGAPAADADEAVRLEAHQQARHARADEQEPAPTGAAPATPPTPAPAWLDTYDDEAQVTQNLDLKTPPPVSASAVRDRGAGEDLVPRS